MPAIPRDVVARALAAVVLLVGVGHHLPTAAAAKTKIEVKIQGIDDALADNARSYLSIANVKDEATLSESRLRYLHRQAPRELRRALEPFGYYSPSTEADLERRESQRWVARYSIDPGEPTCVSELTIELSGDGADDEALRELADNFPLKEGDVLDHRRYAQGKTAVQQALADRGYFDAKLETARVRVEPERARARIDLGWHTGPRYRFGATRFEGGHLRERLLQRYVPYDSGEPYRQEALLALQRALVDSDYFAQVQVEPLREQSTDRQVPIEVTLTPNARDVYSAGVSLGTDSGPGVDVGFERRWLNRRGHRLRADIEATTRRQSGAVRYLIPVKRDDLDRYSATAEVRDERTDTSDRRAFEIELDRVGYWRGWQTIVGMGFLNERFRVGGVSETTNLLMPTLGLSRTRADDALFPRRGHQLEFLAAGAVEGVLSDTSFVQLIAGAKLIRPAFGDDRILLRAKLGTTAESDFDELPASRRFFAGGDRSIRGFDLDAAGPRNAAGDVIGGSHLAVASVEYEHLFRERWGVAAFVDAGNAFDDFGEAFEVGTGIGLRWRSPVGMVRLDLAAGVTRPGTPLRLHLVIGPDL